MNSRGGTLKTLVILFFLLYILQCVVDAFAPFQSQKNSIPSSAAVLKFPSRTAPSSNAHVRNKRHCRYRECTSVNLIDDANDGTGNKGSDAKKRIVSTDEIGSLFSSSGGSGQIKPSPASDDKQEDDYEGDEYEYDYGDDDEEGGEEESEENVNKVGVSSLVEESTQEKESKFPSAPPVTMMDGDEQTEDGEKNMIDQESDVMKKTVDLVSDSDGLKFSPSSSITSSQPAEDNDFVSDEDDKGYRSNADKKYFLDLIDLEKAYAESRTAPEEEMAKEMESGDLDIENNIMVDSEDVEYVWETGMEYIDMERVLEKKQRRSMLDSMSITDKDGKVSQVSSVRDIPQYDPTEYEPNNPMAYGAYRRWKLAESEENDKAGKGRKGGKKKIKSSNGNKDSFFNSLKNLGQGDKQQKGQGFGSRAEPPPNMKPIVPSKPVPKKNRKRVITPDSIDSLFSKPEPVDPEVAAAEDGDVEDEYEDIQLEEECDGDKTSTADSSSDTMIVNFDAAKNDDSDSITDRRDKPINIKSLSEEEPPKWLADADKAAKAERRMKKKKKKSLTKDWRFWAAIITSVGLLSSAFNVYQQTGGSIGPVSSPTELII